MRAAERFENPAGSKHSPRTGLARALSKLGFCSRSQAWELIQAGRVTLNDAIEKNPERSVALGRDRIAVDSEQVARQEKVYLMLNKPRGLVTTADDEHGRATVYECLAGFESPPVAPVGRLDRASEGLLLFTNDHAWAAHLTAPASHVEKTYHVQIDALADDALLAKIEAGIDSEGEHLAARRAKLLRHGEKTSWLEIVLDEGRNRHIRRLLAAFGFEVMRLVRVAIGTLELGALPKGSVRRLSQPEVASLAPTHARTHAGEREAQRPIRPREKFHSRHR